jgi:hypothetical protein
MWNQPYLETCCRSAIHRMILCGDMGRAAERMHHAWNVWPGLVWRGIVLTDDTSRPKLAANGMLGKSLGRS